MERPIATPADPAIAAIRRFSRFYTARIGAVGRSYLGVDLTLTESRTIYEIAQGDGVTARDIGAVLGVDAGYLSRLISRLVRAGLVERRTSLADRRERLLVLTGKGRDLYALMDTRSSREIEAAIGHLGDDDRARLTGAVAEVERLMSGTPAGAVTLRAHRPGDMGWVVMRHAEIYAREYGWGERFEAMVAEIVAAFIRDFDPSRERCWIAERDGVRLGSVFVVAQAADVAKLRLLILDPAARGTGLGRRLVREAVAFARACGYRRMTLWTQSCLTAARAIYLSGGFRLVSSEPYDEIGVPLTSEFWEIDLA